ncbi:hypothetical protein PV773_17940 [Mesorhizobium sp. CC13]|uniref:hypothetical protein n=1 Tax=Mesorhizobium sp. CC13 TaxID=3029194 RepID=UPI0032663D2B
MSVSDREATAAAPRKKLDGKTMAAISPLPPPEEVFIDWLMSVPPGTSIEAAARWQIAVIDSRGLLHQDVQVLRTLLAAVAGRGHWVRPPFNP